VYSYIPGSGVAVWMTIGNSMQLSLWTDSLPAAALAVGAVDACIRTSAVIVRFDVVASNRHWAEITIDIIIVAVMLCFYDVA
jgi:hypothetical protein